MSILEPLLRRLRIGLCEPVCRAKYYLYALALLQKSPVSGSGGPGGIIGGIGGGGGGTINPGGGTVSNELQCVPGTDCSGEAASPVM